MKGWFFFDFDGKYPNDAHILTKDYLKMRAVKKEDIIRKIERKIDEYEIKKEKTLIDDRIIDLLIETGNVVKNIEFPDLTNNLFWSYNIRIMTTGIYVFIQKISNDGVHVNKCHIDELLDLISVQSKMLTTDEFAKLNNVSEITVRQWIRRGKIRNAKKYGNDWRIPELTEPVSRGYLSADYKWRDRLNGFVFQDIDINLYDRASISQTKDKNVYKLFLSGKTSSRLVMLDKKEKEKIEMFFISSPFVTNYDKVFLFDLY